MVVIPAKSLATIASSTALRLSLTFLFF
uniref:Uncharacterized protein n=1 Tax=Rhizophora mucronata TaxID=61149 RepID=A0A2P2NQR9_RHIMU